MKSLTKYQFDISQGDEIINRALREDIGTGDVTTDFILPGDKSVHATIKTKEEGVVAGLHIAEKVFKKLDPDIVWESNFSDGSKIKKDDILARLTGSVKAILTGERTALNFMQRMSGIATATSQFVAALKNYKTQILDTRKTVPGLRMLDKYAVQMGGGTSHRIGLYDMVMIKDNHISIAGGITKAVERVKSKISGGILIEVETSNLREVKEALEANVDIIMLDNMPVDIMREAVKLINGKALVEASGNITLDRIRNIAESGVDFISVGELTHSVKALDIGLYIE